MGSQIRRVLLESVEFTGMGGGPHWRMIGGGLMIVRVINGEGGG